MSGSINKVILVGNIGRTPEIRTTQEGKEIVNMSVATSEKWQDKNTKELKEKTEWHKIVIFNENLVQVAKKYLKKGSKVYIEGSLQTREWIDQQNQKKYTTEIILKGFNSKIIMLNNTPPDYQDSPENEKDADTTQPDKEDLNDEIPF